MKNFIEVIKNNKGKVILFGAAIAGAAVLVKALTKSDDEDTYGDDVIDAEFEGTSDSE